MGFFSPKRTVRVASSLYNLAGEEVDRKNYLKTNIFSATISDSSNFIGETLVTNYLSGPGIKQRQFFNWAVRNNYVGLPTLSIKNAVNINSTTVIPFIPLSPTPIGLVTQITDAFISDGDFSYFAAEHILNTNPSLYETNWISEYDSINDNIVIQYEDNSTETIPAGIYAIDKRFLIAYYYQYVPKNTQPTVNGPLIPNIDEFSNLPSMDTYNFISQTDTTSNSFSMNERTTTTISYSDSQPDDVTVVDNPFTETYTNNTSIYERIDYTGGTATSPQRTNLLYTYNIFERRQIKIQTTITTSSQSVGGVIETTTTVVELDYLDPVWDYRIDTTLTIHDEIFGGNQIFIYEIGSGNIVLDNLDVSVFNPSEPEFYPFIPIRIDNKSINHNDFKNNGLYDQAKRAYRKSTNNANINQIVDTLEDNPDLGEIDYAYVDFGVILNTKENSSKKYIHSFLKQLIPYQDITSSDMDDFINEVNQYNIDLATYKQWLLDNAGESYDGSTPPPIPTIEFPPVSTMKLVTDNTLTRSYDVRISWVNIQETIETGQHETNAIIGKTRLEKQTAISWEPLISLGNRIEVMCIYQQITENSYSKVTAYGLVHNNFIYGGQSVLTTTDTALDDAEDSSFLLPIHYPTIKDMSLVDYTQISTENNYLIINSYQIVKKKWYQTGVFAVIVFVVVLIISFILLGPQGVGSTVGILGTNLAVGTALGLAGTAAIVAGAIVNAIAALIIAKIITTASIAILGDEIGTIVAVVLIFITSGGLDGITNNLSNITADTVLQLSNVLANTYVGWTNSNIADINDQLQSNQLNYQTKLDEISNLLSNLEGSSDISFNPLQLTDLNQSGNGRYLPENLDQFIKRTTMVGSDIVNITLSMVNDYPELSLQLPKN